MGREGGAINHIPGMETIRRGLKFQLLPEERRDWTQYLAP